MAELVFDAWTGVSFKRALGDRRVASMALAPTWVGRHQRRLNAYRILQAYLDNAAREFLEIEEREKEEHREYGDAELIRLSILASLIGDTQTVTADGADLETPNADAVVFQDWLQQWATDERLGLKILECERNSVGLGDGVYSLGWSNEKGRVRLRVWDPGFYFPVLDDGNEDDFPQVVHLAWEQEPEPGDTSTKRRIRRITWRIGDLPPGEVRTYPWSEIPSTQTCYMSDATWLIDTMKQDVEDLTEAEAIYADYTGPDGHIQPWRDIDLRIDFIPVVHLPNTVALLNHFGRSSITTVLQILDDLSNADTDLQASSATTGKPPIALGGASFGDKRPTYRAGEVWEVGEGRLTALDTSKSLQALIEYVKFLLGRLSSNARVPEAVLGRIDKGEISSGFELSLRFGPLEAMVKEMRLVRNEKYPLLLKFAHRISLASQAAGVPPAWIPSRVDFGSFLPSDQSSVIREVVAMVQAKVLSWETALRILQAAGVAVEDIPQEVARIESRDFEGADTLRSATNSETAVADYLGRDAQPAPAPALDIQPPDLPEVE